MTVLNKPTFLSILCVDIPKYVKLESSYLLKSPIAIFNLDSLKTPFPTKISKSEIVSPVTFLNKEGSNFVIMSSNFTLYNLLDT